MRIWDLPPDCLCRQHLLGEHRELHALWTILTEGRTGYANHPETRRWRGKLRALFDRHALLVAELEDRGYEHRSPLDPLMATGEAVQSEYVDSPEAQRRLMEAKGCRCQA